MSKKLKLVLMEDRTTISVSKEVREKITKSANKAGVSIYSFTNEALLYVIKHVKLKFKKKKDKRK